MLDHLESPFSWRLTHGMIVRVASNRCLWILAFALAVVLSTVAPASSGQRVDGVNAFVVRGLVSDGFLAGPTVDSNLVNAWGLAASQTGPWWIANEATETSTVYDGTGRKLARVVTVAGGPTGVVFNGTSGFVVTDGPASAPARFIFACEDGRIRGWAGSVPTEDSNATEVTVDNSHRGAVYRGLAQATAPDGSTYLYAADFHNGRVDVFDANWRPIRWKGAFVDRQDPRLVQRVRDPGDRRADLRHLRVARPRPTATTAPTGGYVDVFDLRGKLLARIGRMGPLNQPVDVALAPPTFGKFGGDLLVGNFGDGRINVYQERASEPVGLSGRVANAGSADPQDQRPLGARVRQRGVGWAQGSALLHGGSAYLARRDRGRCPGPVRHGHARGLGVSPVGASWRSLSRSMRLVREAGRFPSEHSS